MNGMTESSEIVKKTFSRLETIISVTVAGYITQYLQQQQQQQGTSSSSISPVPILLLASVIFLLCTVLSSSSSTVWPMSRDYDTIMTSIRSIVGVMATTSIMQLISTLGGAQGDGGTSASDSAAKNSLLLLSMESSSNALRAGISLQKYNLPVLILGTVFVVAVGCLPSRLKNTAEGSAVYVGIQYAYSDILIMNLPDPMVKRALAMCFVVLFPYYSQLFFASENTASGFVEDGPMEAWREAIQFAGTSFIIDSIMPAQSFNNAAEQIISGLAFVSILHAVIYVCTIHEDRGSNNEGSPNKKGAMDLVGSTLESIGSFTTWRVGRRFFNILEDSMHLDVIQLLTSTMLLIGFVKVIRPYVGASFPKIAQDLLVMISVLKLASSVMLVFQQGNSKDAVILLFAGMVAVRLFLKLFV